MNSDQSTLETPVDAVPPRRRRIIFLLSAVVVTVLAIVILRVLPLDIADLDIKNFITYIIGLLGALVIWSLLPVSLPVKIVAPLLLVGLVAGLFRIEFDVDMGTTWFFRWQARPDELLATGNVSGSAERVVATVKDYPRFLGSDLRATISGLNLETDWDAHPPRVVWRQEIGAGWSGFAIVGDYALTQEQRGNQEMVTCYDLKTGKMIWSHADEGRHSEFLGGDGPRATPTVDGGKVYVQGAFGILNCLDFTNGKRLWSHNILDEFGADYISFGLSGSPLVEGNKVIVSVGAPNDQSLVAFDKDSGEVLWQSGSDRASYASPVAVMLGGVRQIVSVNENSVTGHNADNGKVLWRHPWPSDSDGQAATTQPIYLGDDRMLFSSGYGRGFEVVELINQDGVFSVKSLLRDETLMKTKMSNPIVHQGFVYGLSGGILECVDLETGERQWKKGRYGHGPMMLLDD
ncbi:MAG: PQQ-like beta-propeller repeat protein, partial [Planctomycetales bacterium]